MTQAQTEPSKGVGWEEPPPPRTPRYDWEAIGKRLERSPGRWFKVFDKDKTSTVTALKAGGIKRLRPDWGFETTTANNTRTYPRTCTLWMRYNPDNDERTSK